MAYQNISEDGYYFSGTITVLVWHHNLVLTILSVLGILGIFLNGFVICCFIFHPIVSKYLLWNAYLWIFISLRPEKEMLFICMPNISFSIMRHNPIFIDSYSVQLLAHKSSDSRVSSSICWSSIWHSASYTLWLAVWS